MDTQDTVIVANDGPAADAVQAAVLAAQMKIIDAAVREARRQSWCGEFERIMGQIFPDGPPDGSRYFVDSDGLSCRGVDRDGYVDGFHHETGLDRDGYGRDGRDRDGYNRDGVDRYGWTRDGWNADRTINRDSDEYRARYRFTHRGVDREGFNRDGINVNTGLPRDEHAAFQARQDAETYRFDEDGYDVNGLDRDGYGRDGRDGYDVNGLNRYGERRGQY